MPQRAQLWGQALLVQVMPCLEVLAEVVAEAHAILAIKRDNVINLLHFSALAGSVLLYFRIGRFLFPELRKGLLIFSCLTLIISGVFSNQQIYTAFFSLIIVMVAMVIHWLKWHVVINGRGEFGVLYANFSFIPFLVFLIKHIGL
ncbi:hypothetical protein D4100_02555 [Serratia inhibens]|uniref:Uncharacterized protein n=1 Tax=Serratia inhibens TaxID=2338073 RepID=A0AA93BZI8_9GAMM|nr:hypothetical protein D4100_02555 [Serratia inhibens]